MKAAVTGAGGFIGATLTAHLLARGWDVVALDLPAALPRVPAGARRIGVDIRDPMALREAVRGARVLFHTAALFDLTARWPDLYATNVQGTKHVCAAARKSGVERMVVWSSSSVYGGTKRPVPLTETAEIPLRRLNPYGRSKFLAELEARHDGVAGGPDVIVLRPTEVYGPGSMRGLAQALFAFKSGAMTAVPGPGAVRHSYVHVEDVARAAVHLVEHGAGGGTIYNVASRTPVAAADVYALARRRLGWFSLRDRRITLPDRPRLKGRPLLHVPAMVLQMYARWELLRARRGWLVERFGPYPLANPAGAHLLVHHHVVDATRLFATGFEPTWPDATAGILATLDAYERTGWAPFRPARPLGHALPEGARAPRPSGSVAWR